MNYKRWNAILESWNYYILKLNQWKKSFICKLVFSKNRNSPELFLPPIFHSNKIYSCLFAGRRRLRVATGCCLTTHPRLRQRSSGRIPPSHTVFPSLYWDWGLPIRTWSRCTPTRTSTATSKVGEKVLNKLDDWIVESFRLEKFLSYHYIDNRKKSFMDKVRLKN